MVIRFIQSNIETIKYIEKTIGMVYSYIYFSIRDILVNYPRSQNVRTSIDVDDEIVNVAREYTGVEDDSELVRRAIRFVIAKQRAKNIGKQTGNRQDMKDAFGKLYADVEHF